MYFPEDNSWLNNLDAYQRMRDAMGVQPVPNVQAASAQPAAGADDLVGQLGRLRLEGAGRRRVSDAGASLAPRSTHAGIGGSMRLPASSAASLVDREHVFQSARLAYVPESPVGSPEPARHSSAYAAHSTHPTHFDAPRRNGGLFSGIKKGLKALGFGGGRRRSEASIRRDSTFRMDAPSPGRGESQHTYDEAVDAQVTRHDSPPAEAAPQAPRPARRRRRDEESELARQVAGSVMRAPETALAPPTPQGISPSQEDLQLIEQARIALAATPGIPEKTRKATVSVLTRFSAWLNQVGKPQMAGRLFDPGLMFDAWKLVRVGGHQSTTSALGHLRAIAATGVADIARLERHTNREVPRADRDLINAALRADVRHRNTALAFSEWLSQESLHALTDPMVDDDGVMKAALHTDYMSHLVELYKQSPGAQNVKSVEATLAQLRIFDRTGQTNIKRRSHHLDIPEVDQRLINRYLQEGNRQIREAAQGNVPVDGRTAVDKQSGPLGAFSEWLRDNELPTIAASLHDPALRGLVDDALEKRSTAGAVKTALRAMVRMFPPDAPELAIARIGAERLAEALGSLAPSDSVKDVADRIGASADDLAVFLDAQAHDGLTPVGRNMVETFEGRLRQTAEANIALRQQMMRFAAELGGNWQAPAPTPSSFDPIPTPSGGWPTVYSWSGEASDLQGYGAPSGDGLQGANPVSGDLGPVDSDAQYGGQGPAAADSGFSALSSLNSAHRYGDLEFNPGTTQEVSSLPRGGNAPDGAPAAGPSSSPPSGWPQRQPAQAPDLGYAVVGDWRHGDRYAPPELVNALAFEGMLPNPFTQPTALQIHGQPYTAQAAGGAVWLSWSPASGAELPSGYAAIDRHTLLGRINARMGRANGQGLNCLLDSVVQLAWNTPRQTQSSRALDRHVREMRETLVGAGAVEHQGQLDVYELNNVGATLAQNFGLRLQFIQEVEQAGLFIHPVIGHDGPLVRILHTPGHFQPLWPSQP